MTSKPTEGFIPHSYGGERPQLYLKPPGPLITDADAYFERHIEALRVAWLADCFPPTLLLLEARELCRDHGRLEPEWLYIAIDERLEATESPKRRGRQAKMLRLDQERYSHFIRWAYVRTALKMRDTLPALGYEANRDGDAGVWQFVSDQMQQTPEWGSPESVRRSYYRIKRAIEKAQLQLGDG